MILDETSAKRRFVGKTTKPVFWRWQIAWALAACAGMAWAAFAGQAAVVFETTSPYHHIRVVDDRGVRVLSFDGTMETRMSLANHLVGHFEYTEYFHLPLLFNPGVTNVLMVGLGGGSVQRSYQTYNPHILIDTVEIDKAVVDVAKRFFYVKETPNHRIHVSDGRVFLRRSTSQYGAIIMDAYARNRYGSFIPPHLATKEFFDIARERLTENGVLAYNVMGTFTGWRADVVAALYQTMKSVFPQVYLFPATDSLNVVLIATRSSELLTPPVLQQRAAEWIRSRRTSLPTLQLRASVVRTQPPVSFVRAPVLTDDYAPLNALLGGAQTQR